MYITSVTYKSNCLNQFALPVTYIIIPQDSSQKQQHAPQVFSHRFVFRLDYQPKLGKSSLLVCAAAGSEPNFLFVFVTHPKCRLLKNIVKLSKL